MTDIVFHPLAESLQGYAFGNLTPGMDLFVSGHLTYCAECRSKVAALEGVGGAEIAQASATLPALDAVLARLDEDDEMLGCDVTPLAVTPLPAKDDWRSALPAALRAKVPASDDDMRWQFRLPGLHEHEFDGFDGETVSLLRARPGAKMLSHTHMGSEATLILQGAMADGDDVLRRGDVIEHDEHDDHRPEIVGDETCYCLIVMSGNLRFTGTFTRALNILMR